MFPCYYYVLVSHEGLSHKTILKVPRQALTKKRGMGQEYKYEILLNFTGI